MKKKDYTVPIIIFGFLSLLSFLAFFIAVPILLVFASMDVAIISLIVILVCLVLFTYLGSYFCEKDDLENVDKPAITEILSEYGAATSDKSGEDSKDSNIVDEDLIERFIYGCHIYCDEYCTDFQNQSMEYTYKGKTYRIFKDDLPYIEQLIERLGG